MIESGESSNLSNNSMPRWSQARNVMGVGSGQPTECSAVQKRRRSVRQDPQLRFPAMTYTYISTFHSHGGKHALDVAHSYQSVVPPCFIGELKHETLVTSPYPSGKLGTTILSIPLHQPMDRRCFPGIWLSACDRQGSSDEERGFQRRLTFPRIGVSVARSASS